MNSKELQVLKEALEILKTEGDIYNARSSYNARTCYIELDLYLKELEHEVKDE